MHTATLPAEPGWSVVHYFDGANPRLTLFRRQVRAWYELDGQRDLTRPVLSDGTRPRPGSLLLDPDGAVVDPATRVRLFANLGELRDDMQARWKEQQRRRR